MRERLLNPNRFDIDSKSLDIEIVDGIPYRFFISQYTINHSGSCQCFKDCDCSDKAGTISVITKKWYRNKKFDGTDKCFYTEPYTREVDRI